MTPYCGDELAELWHHDARHVSDVIEPETVDLIVTSPPYFALRSYRDGGEHYDGQLGSEATPAAFIDALIECTAEWVKVLRPTGSMFVNLGDKYSQRVATRPSSHQDGLFPDRPELRKDWKRDRELGFARMPHQNVMVEGGKHIPEKSLMGLPWRYANRCVDDLGLILRAEIIWSKPNGLPESVTDRVRRSHEYIFHLTRQGRYYTAIDEIREPHTGGSNHGRSDGGAPPGGRLERTVAAGERGGTHAATNPDLFNPLGKLPGSVWTIPSEPLVVPDHLGVDHFAAFPSELPRRCILGWTPPGYCLECGQPRRAVIERESAVFSPSPRRLAAIANGSLGRTSPSGTQLQTASTTIVGYGCDCPTPDAPTRPAVVLDPFAGTGTTIAVAKALGRKGIGIDLSRDYLRIAEWRVNDPRLRRKVLERTGIKVPQPPAHDGQEALFT